MKLILTLPGISVDTARVAAGEPAIKCPSPLNVRKDTYDHSCEPVIEPARMNITAFKMTDSPTARRG